VVLELSSKKVDQINENLDLITGFFIFNGEIDKKFIFPLTQRPFGTLELSSPRDPHGYFQSVQYLNVEQVCSSQNWSHKFEQLKDKISVECQRLKQYYPFVERNSTSKTEYLVLNNTLINVVKV